MSELREKAKLTSVDFSVMNENKQQHTHTAAAAAEAALVAAALLAPVAARCSFC